MTKRRDGSANSANTKETLRVGVEDEGVFVFVVVGSTEAPVVAWLSAAEEEGGKDVSIGEATFIELGKNVRVVVGEGTKGATGATMILAMATTDLCK